MPRYGGNRRGVGGDKSIPIGTTYVSGDKSRVWGHYENSEGEVIHFNSARIFPKVSGNDVTWKLMQIGSSTRPYKEGIGRKIKRFTDDHPVATKIAGDVATAIIKKKLGPDDGKG